MINEFEEFLADADEGSPERALRRDYSWNYGIDDPASAKQAVPSRGGPRGRAHKQGAPKRAAPKVTCYFQAQMDDEVVVKHTTTVEVKVSRTVISKAEAAAVARGKSTVDPGRKILVEAIPKKNFDVVGKVREEIDTPGTATTRVLYFHAV